MHFAEIDQNDIVIRVIVADQEFINSGALGDPARWIQTSYNMLGGIHYQPNSRTPRPDQSQALRKNFAGIGYKYDRSRDAFIPPQPYPSWKLHSFSCQWQPPVPYPSDDNYYTWNENSKTWVKS